jgi:polysaccharide export outer membrane protein
MSSRKSFVFLGLLLLVLGGCKSYKQHIMFKYDEDFAFAVRTEAENIQRNYIIQPNDYIRIEVYTKNGERIIDPDLELNKDLGNSQRNTKPDPQYLIKKDSAVKLPMVGDIKLAGYTIDEASKILEASYNEFFTDTYVLVNFTNKRVVVLGGPGGLVIPLENENMSIVEVIALAGGIEVNNKAQNIRLIRGEKVYLIDLSTIESYYNTNQIVQAGDIIYIEPVPRAVTQSAAEISLIVSTITAFTTLLILILSIN